MNYTKHSVKMWNDPKFQVMLIQNNVNGIKVAENIEFIMSDKVQIVEF